MVGMCVLLKINAFISNMQFRRIVVFILLYYSRIKIEGSNTDPLLSWKEDWAEHTDSLSRIYLDDHVAIYTDNPSVVASSSISWLSPRLSLSWKYITDIYGSFGADPHLHVILHTNPIHRGHCRTFTFEIRTFKFRNTIDCGQHSNSSWTWGTNNTANFEWVFINIAKIIQNKAPQGDIHNADKNVCGDKMEDVVVYDIYRHFRGQNDSRRGPRPDPVSVPDDTEPDVIWRKRKSEEPTTAMVDGIHWFRDWFLPIYESYGNSGSSVLRRYYAKVKEVWPRQGRRYRCSMTTLDFVYFWSEATGEDLVPSATNLFSWNATLNESSQSPNDRLSSPFNVQGKPSTLLGWNGKPLNWYQEWFLPIYESYGGVSVLKKYIEIVKNHASRVKGKSLAYFCDMNIGDFVHFWSEAAGVDLAPAARNLFQDSNFESFLTLAKEVSLNYTDSEPIQTRNLSAQRPPGKWLYEEIGENQELKLIYWDKEISIYYSNPPTVSKSTSFFKIISLAWTYAKKTYGPFGPEKLLYIALQDKGNRQCKSSNDVSYYDSYSHDRHFIHCSLPFDQQTSELLAELVISQIGLLAIKLNSETGNWPAKEVSGWSMASILVYDIYMGIGRVEDAFGWNTENMKDNPKRLFGSAGDSSRTRSEMYSKWYKIIYDKYGKTGVLTRFLSILNDRWPKISIPKSQGQGQDYTGQLNVGEFVHFWSEAAGENLFDLAGNVTYFKWGEETVVQMLNATKFYPNIANSSNKTPRRRMNSQAPKEVLNFVVLEKSLGSWQWLRSVHRDPHLVIYVDRNILLPLHESFPVLSTSPWAYLRTSYWFPLQNYDQSITIILRDHNVRGAEDTDGGCKYYENNDTMQILTSDGKVNLRNVFDCQPLAGLNGRNESLDFLWSIMAKEIVKQVEVITEDSNEDDYAVQTMSAIHNTIIFDLYLGVGTFPEARRFLQHIMKTKDDKIFGKKRWFSDWFFPIYVNNGGFSMLNQFTLICIDRRTAIENGNWSSSSKINAGDFVHMWSAAAGANLENLAKNTFVWDKDSPVELQMARENLPGDNNEHLAYLSNADEPPPVKVNASTIEKPEDWFKFYIVAGVAASILAIFFIAVCIKFAMYRRKIQILSQQIRNLTPSEMEEFYQGNPNLSNDDPHVPIHQLPFDRSYEVDTERLIISTSRVLGTGEFGLVRYGTLKGVAEGKSEYGNMAEADDVEVAVKTVKPNVAVSYFKALLSEIKIMAYLGRHENITSLLATVTANIKQCEVFVALEFCAKGDLLHHLKNHGHNFEDLLLHQNKNDTIDRNSKCVYVNKPKSRVTIEGNPKKVKNVKSTAPTYENTVTISTLDLIEWSRQISSGMEYLCVKDVIHGDLAARNVLLTAENVAKISDFGLSRQLVNYSNYKKKSSTPVPWKWLAIESLNSMTFSSFSDVWAFGVTMWEIFTLGKVPYAGKSWNNEFVDELTAGTRLSLPEYANPEIYTVMLDCMKKVPAQRITFLQAIDKLNEIKVSLAASTAESKKSERDFASTSRGHASYMTYND